MSTEELPHVWSRLRDLQYALILGHVLPCWYTLMAGNGDIEVTRRKMYEDLRDQIMPWEVHPDSLFWK